MREKNLNFQLNFVNFQKFLSHFFNLILKFLIFAYQKMSTLFRVDSILLILNMKALNWIILFNLTFLFHLTTISKTKYESSDSLANDSTSHILKEIVISASKTKIYPDHDEMILSPENIKFGTNALDAISSLPLFISKIAGEELLNLQNAKVNVVINGKPSEYSDLMAYSASQVKNVKYYPFTPAQYSLYYNGPVIEVTIKHPDNRFFYSSNRSQTAFDSPSNHPLNFYTNNEITQNTLMDQTNLFRLEYTYNYSHQNHIFSEVVNNIGNVKNNYKTTNGQSRTIQHYFVINYQYNNDNTLFSFLTRFIKSPKGTSRFPMESSPSIDYENENSTRESLIDMQTTSLTSSFFFDHKFKNGLKLMLNLQGNINWANQFESLKIENETSSDFFKETMTKNKNYALELNINSNKKIGNIIFNAKDRLSMSWLNQTYQYEKMPIGTTLNNTIGMGIKWINGNLSLDISLSYLFLHQRISSTEKQTHHIPTGVLTLGRKINDCLSLRGQGSIGTSYKNIGKLLNNKYYDSENYYQKGNFNVKPVTNTYFSLGLNYISKNSKLSAGYTVSLTYNRNAFFQFVLKEGGDYVQTTLNAKYYSAIGNSIYCKYSPFNWIEFYTNLSNSIYRNPQGCKETYIYKTHNNIIFRGQIMFKLKDWNLSFNTSNKDKTYMGDQILTVPTTFGFDIGYRIRDWYFQGLWRYNSRYYQMEMGNDDFLWRQNTRNAAKNLFAVNIHYNFSFGKPQYKETKAITISNDSGLLREN